LLSAEPQVPKYSYPVGEATAQENMPHKLSLLHHSSEDVARLKGLDFDFQKLRMSLQIDKNPSMRNYRTGQNEVA
jgi:hypothetical protein